MSNSTNEYYSSDRGPHAQSRLTTLVSCGFDKWIGTWDDLRRLGGCPICMANRQFNMLTISQSNQIMPFIICKLDGLKIN